VGAVVGLAVAVPVVVTPQPAITRLARIRQLAAMPVATLRRQDERLMVNNLLLAWLDREASAMRATGTLPEPHDCTTV
jgi:hypothetical protein